MPRARLFGNAILTFFAKISTGYWNLFDPTNGFTAVHRTALERIPFAKISNRYFFESDLLFRLNTVRAVVWDMPMKAVYADEESNLRIGSVIVPFLAGHLRNGMLRFFFNYLLRDFSFASAQVLIGLPAVLFGIVFGGLEWHRSVTTGVAASSGTVMVAALPLLIGMQQLMSALSYDMSNIPKVPLQRFTTSVEPNCQAIGGMGALAASEQVANGG